VMPVNNDFLCVSLSLSVPVTYHVKVYLVTNSTTKTVYSIDSVAGETLAVDLLAVFEVELDSSHVSYCQLVVEVSEGTVIRNVDVENAHCNSTSESRIGCLHHGINQ